MSNTSSLPSVIHSLPRNRRISPRIDRLTLKALDLMAKERTVSVSTLALITLRDSVPEHVWRMAKTQMDATARAKARHRAKAKASKTEGAE